VSLASNSDTMATVYAEPRLLPVAGRWDRRIVSNGDCYHELENIVHASVFVPMVHRMLTNRTGAE
jgi:hypothetical protein